MPDKVGQQIGNYRLERLLGSGGFAEVYLGQHVHIHTSAAIKFLKTHLLSQLHIVWCPKYRRKVLVDAVTDRLEQIVREVCQEHKAEVLSLEIMLDLVHLLVECDPQFGIHRLVRYIKGRSSRLLRQEYPKLKTRMPSLWKNSYFVSTVGGAPFSVIKQYIENQKHV